VIPSLLCFNADTEREIRRPPDFAGLIYRLAFWIPVFPFVATASTTCLGTFACNDCDSGDQKRVEQERENRAWLLALEDVPAEQQNEILTNMLDALKKWEKGDRKALHDFDERYNDFFKRHNELIDAWEKAEKGDRKALDDFNKRYPATDKAKKDPR
jgi:hypothetical protein